MTYWLPSIHFISYLFFITLTAPGLSALVPLAKRKLAELNTSGSWSHNISVFLASLPADRRETGTGRGFLFGLHPPVREEAHRTRRLATSLQSAANQGRKREKKKRSGCALGNKLGTCTAALRGATYSCVFVRCRRLVAQIRTLCVRISVCVR